MRSASFSPQSLACCAGSLHRALLRGCARTKCHAHQAVAQTWREGEERPGGGLFAAAWHSDVRHLDLLVKAVAKIDIVVGMSPFLAAWIWKKFEAARFLVKRGADVDFADSKSGRTALHYGVEKEFDPAQLAWLVDHGASPDIKDGKGVSARDRASRKRDKRWLDVIKRAR